MKKKIKDKKLTKDQASKKIELLKKDLFNIRFKKINNQIDNPAQYNEIKKNIARLYTNIKRSTSQQTLNSKDLVINIPTLELIKEEEQKEEGTYDENMNDCDSIRAIIITILLDGIIQIVDVIIRIFY